MELRSAILTRSSCRAYTGAPVPNEALEAILDAANAAPAGLGKYENLHLTVIRNQDFFQALARVTTEFMKKESFPTYGAPMMILVSAKQCPPPCLAEENAAAMIENMMLTATDLGLGSVYLMGCVAALRTSPELTDRLKLPEGFAPIAAVAVGHPKEPLKQRAPSRRIVCVTLD